MHSATRGRHHRRCWRNYSITQNRILSSIERGFGWHKFGRYMPVSVLKTLTRPVNIINLLYKLKCDSTICCSSLIYHKLLDGHSVRTDAILRP